jgi:hypothetical protein
MKNAMKRRGLSDVVTTVLIILLVLAAVAIIWGYLRGALEESGSQISGACLTLDLKAVSCQVASTGVLNSTLVRYGRDSGEGSLVNVTIVYDINGQSVTGYPTTVPKQLETAVFNSTTLPGKPTSVSVAGTVRTESGDLKLCDASPAVTCS